ncbi:MAG: TrmO family methyltransferase domain-containing protein [Gaiella sp.]
MLGLVAERPAQGWDVARVLAPDGELGRLWAVSRPLVYRALDELRDRGYVADRPATPSATGPARTPVSVTPAGRRALRAWYRRPVSHVRELRTELLVKLVLLDRSGADPTALLAAQLQDLEEIEARLARDVGAAGGIERTIALWRLANARGARTFVEALLDERAGDPITYVAIGVVRSPHASLDGMPLQPQADGHGETRVVLSEAHRGCLADLAGFSHVWVVSHLHESVGWGATVDPFLDDEPRGTLATRSPHRPNPIGLSLCALISVDADGVTLAGSDLLDGTPVLDLKPYVPLFDEPVGPVRAGWFEHRAARVFERTSDGRFASRSSRIGA